MGRTACTEPQCLYKGELDLFQRGAIPATMYQYGCRVVKATELADDVNTRSEGIMCNEKLTTAIEARILEAFYIKHKLLLCAFSLNNALHLTTCFGAILWRCFKKF